VISIITEGPWFELQPGGGIRFYFSHIALDLGYEKSFKVDRAKCIHCGLCSADCPTLIIDGKTEFPTIKEGKEDNCLKCQHCLAICPTGAISIWDKEPGNSLAVSDSIPKPLEMERLIKTRRSIRKFKKEEIDKELIHELLTTASYAPTAKNDSVIVS